ncbi:hypothetical protein [Solirubrum puertoriconensis]|uniref:Uncharacterized protein n=1 Tax=Solirubrum puertoriconensis TaxID=1751427 RepID=A0A9X0HKH9_SOLP1|nr:hypothetical protein [Solirubrum puertoriconensis]KUG07619.1 hypothetical protein ASU33_14905 [Solirubrum puertoriconensis]
MRSYDDLDDDLFDDDDELDSSVTNSRPSKGSRKGASSEDSLATKYADYLMWRDTGSSHDEALDLASLTEDEFATAEAQEDPEGSGRYGSGGFGDDEEEDDLGDDDSYEAQRRSRRGNRDYDEDEF